MAFEKVGGGLYNEALVVPDHRTIQQKKGKSWCTS